MLLHAAVSAAPLAVGPSVAAMQWEQRVVLISAPAANDSSLAAQRAVFAGMGDATTERDLRLVEIVGEAVIGAADTAAALRRDYRLPDKGFAVVLLGKDGGVKLRATAPLSAARLMGVIDAMPMRRSERRRAARTASEKD
jgi:hypothetical protein